MSDFPSGSLAPSFSSSSSVSLEKCVELPQLGSRLSGLIYVVVRVSHRVVRPQSVFYSDTY